jgi:hypothetical protein
MEETSAGKVGATVRQSALRLTLTGRDKPGGVPVSGLSIGQVCHNHVLAEVYVDYDDTGHITAVYASNVGSC